MEELYLPHSNLLKSLKLTLHQLYLRHGELSRPCYLWQHCDSGFVAVVFLGVHHRARGKPNA